MTAKFLRVPELSDVPYPAIMEPNLVVEYYAKN
jgi:small subunit ribosomal protein S4